MTVVVRHRCASAHAADALRASVAADNPPFVVVERDGHELVVRLRAPSASSARATLEDLLSCLSAAERAMHAVPREEPRSR